jgi:hypothetical protein
VVEAAGKGRRQAAEPLRTGLPSSVVLATSRAPGQKQCQKTLTRKRDEEEAISGPGSPLIRWF